MDIEVDGKSFKADSTVKVGEDFAKQLIDEKKAELFIEKEIEVVETKEAEVEETEVEEEVVIEKKVDLTVSEEKEVMSIEVKDVKLSPEAKMVRSFRLAKAAKTGIYSEADQKAIQGQGELVAADGGALVDEEIVQGIMKNAIETGQILPKVSKRAVGKNRNALEVKQLDESSGTPADYNGVVLSVTAEGGVISPTKRAFKNTQVAVNKLTAMIPFSDEIMEDDAHGLIADTQNDVGKAFGLKADDEILYGTDSLLTASVGHAGSVAVTLADASNPTIAEIHELYMAQIAPAQAEWYMSGAVYENLNQQESTSGGPVITPNYAVSPFGTLLGRPVNIVNCMLGLNGESGTIGFCDWSAGYVLGTKGGVKQARSMHLYFDSSQEAFRWVWRVAGMPTKCVTMTLKDGRTVAPLVFGNDS